MEYRKELIIEPKIDIEK
jgi:hypothetical protein